MTHFSPSYVASTDVVMRSVAGTTILVPVRGHVADLESIYTLNGIGGRIWELIRDRAELETIVTALCREYEVTEPEAREDALAFLETLDAAGLARLAPASEA